MNNAERHFVIDRAITSIRDHKITKILLILCKRRSRHVQMHISSEI